MLYGISEYLNSMFTSAMAGEVNAETACTSAAEEIRVANDKY